MQIAFVAYPGLTALDIIGPYEVLRMVPDADIRFVWHEIGPVTADSGVLTIGATHTLKETPSPDVLLIGGSSTTTLQTAGDDVLLEWLRAVHETTTWTTSVCSGSLVLAAAGILEGLSATSHWQALPGLKLLGVKPDGQSRIVHEGKVVTAAGVSAGIDLGLWLAGQIAGEKTAKAIQLAIEYDPKPPYDEGHWSKASAGTRTRANALLARDALNRAQLAASAGLAWEAALKAVRRRRSR